MITALVLYDLPAHIDRLAAVRSCGNACRITAAAPESDVGTSIAAGETAEATVSPPAIASASARR